jgi:hypothetical protein
MEHIMSRSFERLEEKNLLSATVGVAQSEVYGNVTAVLTNGTLAIHGGDTNEHIAIFQSSDGKFRVYGEEGSTVNGSLYNVAFTGVSNIEITMGNGNDYVIVRNAHIKGNVSFAFGNGTDDLKVQTCTVCGSVSMTAGKGHDRFYVGLPVATSPGDTTIGGNVTVVGGDGGDYVKVNSVHAARVSVTTGAGNDYVTLRNSTLDSFFANGGLGIDEFHFSLSNRLGSISLLGFEDIYAN